MIGNQPSEWFQMADVRRRRLAAGIWIPLRQCETLAERGMYGQPGYFSESLSVGSLAVHAGQRAIGERLSWDDIGLSMTPAPMPSKTAVTSPLMSTYSMKTSLRWARNSYF
ncbi:hypothetical protein PS691_01941 [Pseudomonas fluorescens]|uniref:Uncharacterized protein n=1 Tax=Pseudomonas fluorescens TaxID=294 RepID=A0A5E7BK35_PSEFL|nr:hypothetical protein PS691_01941 [Pseudomonas fluorescens]